MDEKDIFDLSVAKEEGKFVEKSLLLEQLNLSLKILLLWLGVVMC